jgi:protein O-GlcNAc transferase
LNKRNKGKMQQGEGKRSGPIIEQQLNIQQSIDKILDDFSQNRLTQAEELFQQVLDLVSDEPQFLNMLGVVAFQIGNKEQALEIIAKAIVINPNVADYHYNLGNLQFQQGLFEEAVVSYENTLEINSEYVDAYNNQALALKELGRLNEAEAIFKEVISLNSLYADAYVNLGLLYEDASRWDDAIDSYKMSLYINPGLDFVHLNLGNAYSKQGDFESAIDCFTVALSTSPDLDHIYFNLGNAYKELENYELAVDCYQKSSILSDAVLALETDVSDDPLDVNRHFNLANMYASLCRWDEAISCFKKALSINPNISEIHFNKGNVYKNIGAFESAIASYQMSIDLDPNVGRAHHNLANTFQALGRMEEAINSFRTVISISPDNAKAHSVLVFLHTFIADITGEIMLKEARHWNDLHSYKDIMTGYQNTHDPDRRIRIGYVSTDFKNHAVAYLLEPLLKDHNRDEVEVYCYAEVASPDKVTRRFEEHSDHWRSTVGVSDDEMCAMIRRDEIDIIIECAGQTINNRLVALSQKPAPLMVNYFTMHGQTLGMPVMDYILGDSTIMPQGFEDQCSEKLICLEHGAFPFLPIHDWPEVASPREIGEEMVFACVGDPARISEDTIDLWARLLNLNPDAKLLFKFQVYGDPKRLQYWQQKFARLGERVIFEDIDGGWGKHMDVYSRIDVVLSTLPVAGGTTCAIPLWMGVPVVTMVSKYIGHRIAMSVLTYSGFPQFIANDEDDYLKITTELINDRARLGKLRRELRQKMKNAPICNSHAHVKDIEAAYRTMWKTWCKTQN